METIFLAHSFRKQEKVVDAVRDLLEGHGLTVVTGRHLTGGPLTEEVMKKIDDADGFVAILSPRRSRDKTPSDWVVQELTSAREKGKRAVALAHHNVELGGPAASHANIEYDPRDLTPAIVSLTHTVVQWKQEAGTVLRVEVLPENLAKRLGSPPPDEIEYRLRPGAGRWGAWQAASVDSERTSAFIDVRIRQNHEHVQLRANVDNRKWRSESTPLWLPVKLKRK